MPSDTWKSKHAIRGFAERPCHSPPGNIQMKPSRPQTKSKDPWQGSVMPLFGDIMCRECYLAWIYPFVPEYCPQCGIKLTDQPGEGYEPLYRAMEKNGINLNFWVCPHCQLRIDELVPCDMCPRCFNPVVRPWHRRLQLWLRRMLARH
jgi:hypothetical protein